MSVETTFLPTSPPYCYHSKRHHVHQQVSTATSPFLLPVIGLRRTLQPANLTSPRPHRLHSKFFTLGQVIETVRGGGIFQPAIDEAIQKLQAGEWVRLSGRGCSEASLAD